ncbi:MAG: hypothetical protein [Bacteriophage sp.]|nr:MAG: hypothetical protein [Bacteriophage sp.]
MHTSLMVVCITKSIILTWLSRIDGKLGVILSNKFKSSISIESFNKALVCSVKKTTYSEQELADIDKKTDKLYRRLVLKRSK